MIKYTPEQRISSFWNKVNKNGSIPAHCPELGNCWEWTACLTDNGYGLIGITKGKNLRTHRFSWELTYGTIPIGLFVLHKCDNRKCVNPTHLFLGTKRDNTIDMISKGRGGVPPVLKGEEIGTHKLTLEAVNNIRCRYVRGQITMQKLADEYGVHVSHIHRILHKVSWA